MAHQEEEGLFGNQGSAPVTHNTFNNYGTVGQASQSGDININQNALTFQEIEKARNLLGEAQHQLELIDATPATQKAKDAIGHAREKLDKDTLGTAVTALKKVQDGLGAVAGATESAAKIGGLLAPLAALLV